MRLLATAVHPDILDLSQTTIHRKATRAIVLKNDEILLMYTARYHDYTLPGGGLDKNENLIDGLRRELTEETGAQNINNITAFGLYEEFRPWHKDNADIMHMESYCYTCGIDDELSATAFEAHEVQNGMEPVWMNIHQAIEHNEETMEKSSKKGLSIERETFLLKRIVAELITPTSTQTNS